MSSRFTRHDLVQTTDYTEFEFLCHDLMSREGYKDIEPLGRSNDKGRDAIHTSKTDETVTIFAYSVREDAERKLFEDLATIQKHQHICHQVVFVTTSELSATKKDNLKVCVKEKYGWGLEIYDLERIATLIDNHYQDLRQLHPSIFVFSLSLSSESTLSDTLDRGLYADFLLRSYDEWLEKYTPLLAEYREIETFVVLASASASASTDDIPVVAIPEIAPISIILGESGAGKTTALWRIVVEESKAIKEANGDRIPVLFSLRGWEPSHRCRDLVQDEFHLVGASFQAIENELLYGNCLILVDGLNELSPVDRVRRDAYRDLQRFIITYSQNRFVICCRTSDYEPRLLDLEQLRPRISEPKVFEIKRLDRKQVTDYIKRHLGDCSDEADQLLTRLDIDNDLAWTSPTSFIQLTRIPLYLQLIITEFQRTQQLPNTRAELLKTLVHKAMLRETVRHTANIDRFGKERLLGHLAYEAIRQGYSLRLPDYLAQTIVRDAVQSLKQIGLIETSLTFGLAWQEILSNNFLKAVDWQWVEWLHQLIFDYFTACEIVRIKTDAKEEELRELNACLGGRTRVGGRTRDRGHIGVQACVIALGLFDPTHGADFLRQLLQIGDRLAQGAFTGQSMADQLQLAKTTIDQIAREYHPTNGQLRHLAVRLPYYSVVQALFEYFRANADDIRPLVAESIANMIVEHYECLVNAASSGFGHEKTVGYLPPDETERRRLAIKRGIEVLEAWIGNRNELVRFYAAKGLWETDRGRASQAFKGLLLSKDKNVVNLVHALAEEWGIS